MKTEQKLKDLEAEQKLIKGLTKKEYQRKYRENRYKTDEIFRKKVIETSKIQQRKNPEKKKERDKKYWLKNKEKLSIRQKEKYSKNREKYLEQKKIYYGKNKEEIKIHYKELRLKRKLKLLERLGNKCSRCGYNEFRDALDIHHIIPKSEGGGNNFYNLQILCSNCHRGKTFKRW